MESTADDTQVTVRFVTKLPPDLRVPEDALAVPTNIKRLGLSKIINHLLALEPAKPFDFAVGGRLLRGTLQELLAAEQISVESILEVEYLPIVVPPKTKESAVHDEWISVVDASISNEILSGSYDGAIRAWSGTLECKWSLPAHETPITGLARVTLPDRQMIITSGQENTVRAWKLPKKPGKNASIVALLKGHKEVVQSVCANPSGTKCCTASWDATARIWPCGGDLLNSGISGGENGAAADENGATKKRKVENGGGIVSGESSAIEVESSSVLEGHTGAVSAVKWEEEETIITGGWDHTVRRWDVETGANIDTHNGRKVVHSISPCQGSSLIAFVGADPALRIWDPRDQSDAISLKTFKSHSGWVVGVEWSRHSEFHVATCSYDETVKMWDVRGAIPLGTIDSHEDKVLCVDWVGKEGLVSGGADCNLKLHMSDN
ncbi:hypothetical protein BSKO_00076 [Bryopsis sp. KO-2023]|nr:hypothetical protein BSKO_00076 [Bryopsis sp. KO-2023]